MTRPGLAELEAEIGRRLNTSATAALETAAKVADSWAAAYPADIWPEDSQSLDAKAARHGRHVARCIAEDIRALALNIANRTKETP